MEEISIQSSNKEVISRVKAKITLLFIRFLRSNEIFDRIMSNSLQFFLQILLIDPFCTFSAFPSPFPSSSFPLLFSTFCFSPLFTSCSRSIPLSRATKRTGHDNSTIFLYRFLKSALWCQEDHAKYKNVKI